MKPQLLVLLAASAVLSSCGSVRMAMPDMRNIGGMRGGDALALYPVGSNSGGGGGGCCAFEDIGYAQWDNAEPPYRLYPGDELEVVVPSAPENNKTAVVQPDGRISLPLIGQIMTAGRDLEDIKAEAQARYARELLRPRVEMTVKAAPIKILVGGEVNNPGAYDMIGDTDALRAIMQAGGSKSAGNMKNVIIIRRTPDGRPSARSANLAQAMNLHAGRTPDLVPLFRGDIVFVPKTTIATVGQFVQQYLRDPLPIQFSYAINGSTFVNTN